MWGLLYVTRTDFYYSSLKKLHSMQKKKKKNKKPSKYPEAVKCYGVAYYTEIVHKNWCVHLAGESVL